MFYKKLFKCYTGTTEERYAMELAMAKQAEVSELRCNENLVLQVLQSLQPNGMFGYQAFYSSDVMKTKSPCLADILAVTPEGIEAYICVESPPRIIVPTDIYEDWVLLGEREISRITSPVLQGIPSILNLCRQLNLGVGRVNVACCFSDNVNVLGGPIVAGNVRIGRFSDIKLASCWWAQKGSLDDSSISRISAELRDIFNLKAREDVRGPEAQPLCQSCGFPLTKDGVCPACAASNDT